jgi:hypothetical protein
MIVRIGFHTFDFQSPFELPKPLYFATGEDALNWLKHLWSQYPDLVSRFREYLVRYSDNDRDGSRLTDYQTIERLAILLHSRGLWCLPGRVDPVAGRQRRGSK